MWLGIKLFKLCDCIFTFFFFFTVFSFTFCSFQVKGAIKKHEKKNEVKSSGLVLPVTTRSINPNIVLDILNTY